MNIIFKVNGMDIDDAVKTYTTEKVESLKKFVHGALEPDARVEVEYTKDEKHHAGELYRADIVVVAGGTDMHAIGHGESAQAAVDDARDELVRRLSRDSDKARNLLRKGSRAIKRMLRLG